MGGDQLLLQVQGLRIKAGDLAFGFKKVKGLRAAKNGK